MEESGFAQTDSPGDLAHSDARVTIDGELGFGDFEDLLATAGRRKLFGILLGFRQSGFSLGV